MHTKQSSAYYAHSNTRAEVGVKSGKRLFTDNMDPEGRVNNHNFLRAMLKYRKSDPRIFARLLFQEPLSGARRNAIAKYLKR